MATAGPTFYDDDAIFATYNLRRKRIPLFLFMAGRKEDGISGELSWLLSTDYWGRGLATELGQASIDYGIMKLRLVRIFATAYRANLASVRVMEKLGMRLVHADAAEVEYEVVRQTLDVTNPPPPAS